jgi:hypothetical protein
MGIVRSTHRLRLLACAGIGGLLLAVMPLGLNGSNFGPKQAWAGNGHGQGGGSHGGGHGSASANGHENHGSPAGGQDAPDASDTALANASPNSRVSNIAALKEAELAAQTAASYAKAAIFEAQTALNRTLVDALTDGTVTADEQAAIDAAKDNVVAITTANEPIIAAAEQAEADTNTVLIDAAN